MSSSGLRQISHTAYRPVPPPPMPPPPPPSRPSLHGRQLPRAKPFAPLHRPLAPLSSRNKAKLTLLQRRMETVQALVDLGTIQEMQQRQQQEVLRAQWEEIQADPDGTLSAELSAGGFSFPLQSSTSPPPSAKQKHKTAAPPRPPTAGTTTKPKKASTTEARGKQPPAQAGAEQQQHKTGLGLQLSNSPWTTLSFEFGVSECHTPTDIDRWTIRIILTKNLLHLSCRSCTST